MKRTAIQRRTPLRPKAPPPRHARQWEGEAPKVAPARATLRSDTRARMAVPVPKTEKAKPGKRAPTVAEKAWMDAITAIGCIACLIDGRPGTPGAVHHILRGGQRIGHLHSICLCDPGHHQNGQERGVVSRHPTKARFEARYGTESELLARSRALVNSTTTRREPALTEG